MTNKRLRHEYHNVIEGTAAAGAAWRHCRPDKQLVSLILATHERKHTDTRFLGSRAVNRTTKY